MMDASVKQDLAHAARGRASGQAADPEGALRAGSRAVARRLALTYAALVVAVAGLVVGGSVVLARGDPADPPPPPGVTGLVVTPEQVTVRPGEPAQLAAVAAHSDGSDRDVTVLADWQSSDPTVVTVDDDGAATGAGPGTATVTATWSGHRAGTTVTVPDEVVAVTAVSVSPREVELITGQTVPFAALATRSDGSAHLVTEGVLWGSSDPDVASVDPVGVATARRTGTTSITASFSGVVGGATLTVREPSPVRLSVSPPRVTLVTGQTQGLAARATLEDGRTLDVTDRAAWRSADTEVADLDTRGSVVAVGAGSTVVTATFAGLRTSVTVTVTDPDPVLVRLIVSPRETNVCTEGDGRQVQLTATARYDDPDHEANGSTPEGVTWASDDESVATVDPETGLVEVVGSQAGTVIRATVDDVTGTARVSCFDVE